MKAFLQKMNPLTGCMEWDIGVDDDVFDKHQNIARSAFADMLHDTERNKLYYSALKLAIEKMHRDGKKANVLDIGTGTGILSMMAVKCGADSVVACEAFKPMAECCQKILAKNGVANKIKLIAKESTNITVGRCCDMEEKANILVTEVFDTELIGEGALHIFKHAHEELLEKDCIVIPDSAVVYAQVVECPFLQKFSSVGDVDAPELGVTLKTPHKMKTCLGTAGLFDIQLSQVKRSSFEELSEKIPMLSYDWSGKSPLELKKTVKQDFTVLKDGKAQMVFVWWELNMDPEGTSVLSCAPWWHHPSASLSSEHPEDTVPWRDHWLQAVYFLHEQTPLKKDQESTLVACQDEYSLCFFIDYEIPILGHYITPLCNCGIHMAWSRLQIAYLNNEKKSAIVRNQLKQEVNEDSVVLDLNGCSFLGLLASKIAKKVYIHENARLNKHVLQDYIQCNRLDNVEIVESLDDAALLNEITNVICDPLFTTSVLPWDNLRFACVYYNYMRHMNIEVSLMHKSAEIWAMPVEFLDLHKIRVPVGSCEGFDVSIFDKLVEKSRCISDQTMEPLPVWQYPARCSGLSRRLLRIEFELMELKNEASGTFKFSNLASVEEEPGFPVNGFVLWIEWNNKDGMKRDPEKLRQRLEWDADLQVAVHLLKTPRIVQPSDKWSFKVDCDIYRGRCDVNVGMAE